jgi:GT2 family glycosyltransferase
MRGGGRTTAATGESEPAASDEPRRKDRTPRRTPCTAVVVTYQSARHVGALLHALTEERRSGLDLEVVVVDNASTDGTGAIVSTFDGVRWIAAGGNLGYAAGVNLGSRLAAADRAVAVLNPDLVPSHGAIAELLDALDRPGTGVVVPRVENADGSLCPSLRFEPSLGRALVDAVLGAQARRVRRGWSGMVWNPGDYLVEQQPDWAVGAALVVSPLCRERVGDWDERYFLYSEETDYLRRVREAGLEVRYVPGSTVRHVGGGSGSSDGLYALWAVNLVRYYRRYHRRWPSAVYQAVVILHQVLRWNRPQARLAARALLFSRVRAGLPHPTTTTTAHDHGATHA